MDPESISAIVFGILALAGLAAAWRGGKKGGQKRWRSFACTFRE